MPKHTLQHPLFASLGLRLKSERHRLRLTQQELADRLGISCRAIQHYEIGKNSIRLDVAYGMLDAGIDVGFVLFDRPGITTPP